MPASPYQTLSKIFIKRVTETTRHERDAALEESQQPRATSRLAFNRHGDVVFTVPSIVTPEDVEMFCNYGIWPRSSWPRSLWPIRIDEPREVPAELTALERVELAALRERNRFVRELRNSTLVATRRFKTLDADQQQIEPEEWLSDDICFDVRTPTVWKVSWRIDRFDSLKVDPLWVKVQVRGAAPIETAPPTTDAKPRGAKPLHGWTGAQAALIAARENGDKRPRIRIIRDYFDSEKLAVPDDTTIYRHLKRHPDGWPA